MLVADKHIASSSNAVYRSLHECLSSKGIRKNGLFLVAGERAVRETLERYPKLVRDLLISSGDMQNEKLFGLGALAGKAKSAGGLSVVSLEKPLFSELDLFGTHYPLLAVSTPEIAQADLTKAPVGLEILCGLGDPSNVGALMRSASAFGASRIVFLKESASPFHPKAVRASSASTLHLPLASGPSIRDLEKVPGLVALDMEGESLHSFKWPVNTRLLMGEEGQGLPSGRFARISIPINEGVESLNATVASSIALYSYRQSHSL